MTAHVTVAQAEALCDSCMATDVTFAQQSIHGKERTVAHLVESHNEGSLAHLEQVDGLNGLLLQPVHHVHNQNGNVTQAGTTGPQIGEGLVTCTASRGLACRVHAAEAACREKKLRRGNMCNTKEHPASLPQKRWMAHTATQYNQACSREAHVITWSPACGDVDYRSAMTAVVSQESGSCIWVLH